MGLCPAAPPMPGGVSCWGGSRYLDAGGGEVLAGFPRCLPPALCSHIPPHPVPSSGKAAKKLPVTSEPHSPWCLCRARLRFAHGGRCRGSCQEGSGQGLRGGRRQEVGAGPGGETVLRGPALAVAPGVWRTGRAVYSRRPGRRTGDWRRYSSQRGREVVRWSAHSPGQPRVGGMDAEATFLSVLW